MAHAAPLGLNAPVLLSPDGLGNPTPTDLTSRFSLYPCNPLICRIGDSDKEDMSPLWGFKIFVCRVCYKHVAPLGLKAPMHQNSRDGIHRRGGVASPDGLGDPTPTDSTFPFSALSVQSFNPCNPRFRQRDMSPVYKHVAPLGLYWFIMFFSSYLR